MSESTILPPSASRSGKNAYYLGQCKHVGHAPAYAACLAKLNDPDRIRKHANCVWATGVNECQAFNMQREEELQGKALYFVPRQVSPLDPVVKGPAWSEAAQPTVTVAPPIARTTAPKPLLDTGSYADAITAAVNAAQPPEGHRPSVVAAALTTPSASPPSMLPGETPMQFARRAAAARTTNQESPQS